MKTMIRFFLLGLLVTFGLIAATERSTQIEVSAQGNQVTLSNFKFEPKTLTVPEGTTVTWTNKEGTHTIKSDADAFGSKTLKAGESFTYEFTKAGKYPYYCGFHGSKGGGDMAGVIIVTKKK